MHCCLTFTIFFADLTGLCYYSDVQTCCKEAISVFKYKSVTDVQVGAKIASVTHYQKGRLLDA